MHDDAHLRWTVLAREPGHDYRIFRSTFRHARHAGRGVERRFTVLEMPDWVNVVALTPADDIVLVRQWRHGIERVTLEIPGGVVDPGEDDATTAARELREETGFVAAAWRRLGTTAANPAIQSNRLHTWLALDARRDGPPTPDAGEVMDVVTVPLLEVGAMLDDGRIDHALVLTAFAHLMRVAGGLRRPA